MKKVFKYICIPLMLINNNVYTFISGIVLSLATGIITELCLDKSSFLSSWHLYISSVAFTIGGAMLIYIATRISSYQNYISAKQIIDRTEQKTIIEDFELKKSSSWFFLFLVQICSLLSGTILLFLNYII